MRLAKDIVVSSIGQILSLLIYLGFIKVWATFLPPADFARMALLLTTATSIVGLVMQPHLQAVMTLYTEYFNSSLSSMFRMTSIDIIRRRLTGIGLLLGIPAVLLAFLDLVHWSWVLIVAGLIVIDTFRVHEQMLVVSAGRHIASVFIMVGDQACRLLCLWLTLEFVSAGGEWAAAGNLAGAAIFLAMLAMTVRREGRQQVEGTDSNNGTSSHLRQEIERRLRRLSRPLGPSMLILSSHETGLRYFVAWLLGLHAAGLFQMAYGLVGRPFGMLNHVGEMVMAPRLRKALAHGNDAYARRLRLQWLLFIALLSLAGIIAFALLAPMIVRHFLSEDYAAITVFIPWLAFAVALFTLNNVYNWFFITLEASKYVPQNLVIGIGFSLAMMLLLVQFLGMMGIAFGMMAGYAMQLLISGLRLRKLQKKYLIR